MQVTGLPFSVYTNIFHLNSTFQHCFYSQRSKKAEGQRDEASPSSK